MDASASGPAPAHHRSNGSSVATPVRTTEDSMTAPFPHRYQASIEFAPRRAARVSAPPRPVILGGPPPEFDGHEEQWSPEHLLLSSAALCFTLTFDALAKRAQWPYESLAVD